jgi:hypothetical protein
MVARKVSELGPLSDAETQVLAALDTGEVTVLSDGSVAKDGDENRRVRALLLRLLLLGHDPDPKYRLHEKGLRVAAAWIPRQLDLEGCRIPHAIALLGCHFDSAPMLRFASVDGLYLDRSSLPGLNADQLEVQGGVSLRGVQATAKVSIIGALLDGSLDCTDASFRAEKDAFGNPDIAFAADGMDVRGNVFLRRVQAVGEVRLVGATLGGELNCKGSRLQAETDTNGVPGPAFHATRLDARGGVFLDDLQASGAVLLLGATLGGDLACVGATFRAERNAWGNPGFAFAADGLNAKGSVFLRGVQATGQVRLPGAHLGRDLDCMGARFQAERECLRQSQRRVRSRRADCEDRIPEQRKGNRGNAAA